MSSVDIAPSIPATSRYRARVDGVSPARDRFTFESAPSAFLGVSLANPSFTGDKLRAMVAWLARTFPRCTVLVGDSIHRITLEQEGWAPEDARAEAVRRGQAFLEAERDTFLEASDAFRFLTCSEVATTPDYAALHAGLVALYARDARFAGSIERFATVYLTRNGRTPTPEELAAGIGFARDYFLEEFAVIGCMVRRGDAVMVYPGTFSTLAEVAEGEHPDAPDVLRRLTTVSLKFQKR